VTASHQQHRKLALRLTLMACGAFVFGFALVPLYGVLCKVTGYGDRQTLAQASLVTEAPVSNREVTIEFVSATPTFGDWEFRPLLASIAVHPGRLYEAKFYARNLRTQPVTAQAVPSIAPQSATAYFHKTDCFCFTPQHFAGAQTRELAVRFIVDPKLPSNIDRLTLGYSMFTVADKAAGARG
jgi:cytochrome c oxidase assembly protein subunit 11